MSEAPLSAVQTWIDALQSRLDGLEYALLQGDANAVQLASAEVQVALQDAPKTREWSQPGSSVLTDFKQAAHRFGQLRHAVLRAHAQSQRAVHSLLPQQAPATYGRAMGQTASTGGAGRAYLSA
ncbi:hypothetical protein [Hydrogenophaga sp.]|uniref:hypothetical protein n=1 Tax=Hydrogenophaga sp. TaxID=1904254 RepID=UPI0025C26A13|nr:hypothetical protein [Hydrogenophaga sp.]